MDIMNVKKDKKKLIIIGSVGVLLIIGIVTTILVIKNTDSSKSSDKNNSTDNNSWSENGKYGYEQSVDEDQMGSENVQVVIPTTMYGGTVGTYEDLSTYGELSVHIGGNVDNNKTFKLVTSGIVFDAHTNKVVKPSEIKKEKNIRVLALGDTKTGAETAEVVILNDKPEITYTPVTNVETTDDSKGYFLLNDATQRKYYIDEKTKVINALSGEVLEERSFSTGDRLFMYDVKEDKNNSTNTTKKPTSSNGKINGDYNGTLDSVNYTAFTSNEVYVYPINK